jgi:hypothetical protein
MTDARPSTHKSHQKEGPLSVGVRSIDADFSSFVVKKRERRTR